MPELRGIVVMGVSGSGKSTLGKALGRALHAPFIEGDELHPDANRAKMAAGTPLDDEDRWPWLDALGHAMRREAPRKGVVVAACSALKTSYRERLAAAAALKLTFVHLEGTPELLAKRMEGRSGHFMPPSLLQSQLDTLEAPGPGEDAVTVSMEMSTERQVAAALRGLPGLRAFRRKQ